MGHDPCGEFKRSKASSVLASVRERNVTYSLCKTKLSSTQSLRSHIRSKHLEEFQQQFKCQQCNVACGGAYALKVHMRVHSATRRPYLCAVCGKSFATVGHLHQHQVEHTGRTLACQYCGKKILLPKGLCWIMKRGAKTNQEAGQPKDSNVISVMLPITSKRI